MFWHLNDSSSDKHFQTIAMGQYQQQVQNHEDQSIKAHDPDPVQNGISCNKTWEPIDDFFNEAFDLQGEPFGQYRFEHTVSACKLQQFETDFETLYKSSHSSTDPMRTYTDSIPESEDSEWAWELIPDGPGLASHAWAQDDCPSDASSNGRATPPSCSKGQKRPMTPAISTQETGIDSPRRRDAPKSSNILECIKRRDQLACPFQKRDPHKHQECLKYTLHRIKDVKQHIYRRHRQPDYYCARCSNVFNSMANRDRHVRHADCKMRPMPRFEGISDEQRNRLNRSSSRTLDHQGQWFEIWDIIFEGEERPASALVGSYTEEMVPLIRSLWNEQQVQIMDHVLENNGSDNFGRSDLNKIMSCLLECLEKATSGSLAGYVQRSKVQHTMPDPDATTFPFITGISQTIAPEFDAASDLGFKNPY
ncbi:hypothetical protein VPNG_05240 [Cytospora leucostoma]|uniref:C2H2-type domain-containing protein n=1 Tax=Cytospora leucostoma TaxID=1230097 RepID=A0A423X846_9PEZI|nr:hypothetical protein VPNG_05240 [Cytospora leucostoma]